MNRRKRTGALLAAGVLAALLLCSCSAPGRPAAGGSGSVSQSQPETKTIQGTVNKIDTQQEFLVLVTEDAYYRFDLEGCQADLSGLEPGDGVTVTYTGELDEESDDVTAALVDITKN